MRRDKLKSGWFFDCECARCADPIELGAFTSATICLKCGGNGILTPLEPLKRNSAWRCDSCDFSTSSDSVDKLVDYFLNKVHSLRPDDIKEAEAVLEKAERMFHAHHYVLNLIRIAMNSGYIRLAARTGLEPDKVPVEVFMRRKDLLDVIQAVIEVVEPGLTRRRGISLFETATCHLQVGRMLNDEDRFPDDDFLQLLETELESPKVRKKLSKSVTMKLGYIRLAAQTASNLRSF